MALLGKCSFIVGLVIAVAGGLGQQCRLGAREQKKGSEICRDIPRYAGI